MAEDHGLCANLCSKSHQSQSTPTVGSTFRVPILTAQIAPRLQARVETDPIVPNRCGMCRRRVGLTGFMCRCGVTCCGAHRHAEQHGCTWDYKGAGKEAIARDNPVVKADKVVKI